MRTLAPILAVLIAIAAFFAFALRGGEDSATNQDPQTPETSSTVVESAQTPASPADVPDTPDTSDAPDTPDTPGESQAQTPAEQVQAAAQDAADRVVNAVDRVADAAAETVKKAASKVEAALSTPALRFLTVAELNDREAGEWTDAPAVLGSTDQATGYPFEVTLNKFGAALERLAMSEYNNSVDEDAQPYVVLDKQQPGGALGPIYRHFAASRLWINGQEVLAVGDDGQTFTPQRVWWGNNGVKTQGGRQSVTFVLAVVDAEDRPVIDIHRTYRVTQGAYDLTLEQTVINRSDATQKVRFEHYLQGEIEPDAVSYMGDRRQVVLGTFSPSKDPRQARVYTDGGFYGRDGFIKRVRKGRGVVFPYAEGATDSLAWLATENRYFAVATHAHVAESVESTAGVSPLSSNYLEVRALAHAAGADQSVLTFTAQSKDFDLAPGASQAFNLGVFAGPRTKENFQGHPYDLLGFAQLIKYELGCTWCTFQWLARGLLAFLNIIHDVVGDWGVAIIVLVLVVRLILHPITKKSQVNMMVFGKQMQAMQPEMEKLKKKYGDDAAKMQQEQIKLWREHGVNPLRMLGCLPMFLQMPIWVALYAMIYFAVELWQQPAFYGVFQAMGLSFLADLAVPDRLIVFTDEPVHVFGFKLLDFSSFNVLPLVWTVINIVNMKLTQPPAMTEQAAQQQKIMRVMMCLFAFWLYSAPSALTLYMCASTSIGILDATLVRRHVKKLEAEGKLLPAPGTPGTPGSPGAPASGGDDKPAKAPKAKKPPKPGSLRAKLQARLEMAQKMVEQQQQAREQQLKQHGQADSSMGGNRAQRRASQRRKK